MERTDVGLSSRPGRRIRAHGRRIEPGRALLAAAVALLLAASSCGTMMERTPDRLLLFSADSIDQIKPITGTWLNVQWPDARYRYMNEAQAAYACGDWARKVSEMAEIGIRYLVFQSVAQGGKAFYRSTLLPGAGLACDDPVGAVVRAAEKHGVKVFLSCEFVGSEDDSIGDPKIMKSRIAIMRDVAARFGESPAFYGWYLSAEGDAGALFGPAYIEYVNTLAAEARKLTPGARILVAPKGLVHVRWNDEYLKRLDSLDVDIVAYQDKVGCAQTPNPIEVSRIQFAAARAMHDRIPRVALWADIETFAWEGPPNSRASALVPAPFSHVLEQMAAVSPYVERTLAFTMLGMADKPGSPVPTGHPTAQEQYRQYRRFLDQKLDMLVLRDAIAGRVRHAAVGAQVALKTKAEAPDFGFELTDGKAASMYNRRDGWVKFTDGAMDIVVDLGSRMKIKYLGINLLAEHYNGIFLPEKVSFSVSDDGAKFAPAGEVEPYPWLPSNHDTRRELLVAPRIKSKARYVRITSQGVQIPDKLSPRDTVILASEVIVNPEVRHTRGTKR